MKLGVSSFFSDVANFVRGGRVLGVDIGTSSVKMVELSRKGDTFRLDNYGVLETSDYLDYPNQAIQAASLKIDPKRAAQLLDVLLQEVRPRSKVALVSLPAFSVFVAPLEIPLISPSETQQAVMFQAKNLIPLPSSEVSIDWTKVGEFENKKGQTYQRILLMGIPEEIVVRYREIFKMVGLRLVSVELESLALIRALLGGYNQIVLLVDIGAEATSVAISDNGSLKYSGQSDHGGLYLTGALNRSLGVTMMRAEELKRRRGLLGKGGEFELSTLLLSFLDVIIEEVNNVRGVYERRYSKKVERLVLTGGGANLLGIDKYFGEQLGLQLYRPDLFVDVQYGPSLEPAMKGLGNELAAAVGMAKRYFK